MKIYRYIIILLIFCASCGKDYLETSPKTYINFEDYGKSAKKNPDLLISTLNGIYKEMVDLKVGNTNLACDFGQKSIDIFTDMLCGDMALTKNQFNVYSRFANLQTTNDYTKEENSIPWTYYYKIINHSNALITSLSGIYPSKNKELNYVMGQCKALRAYAYFYLLQLYSIEYKPNEHILPLLLTPEQSVEPQSTNETVYNQIIKDLKEAIILLQGYSRKGIKYKINQDIAKALLAYVYASMENTNFYEDAKKLTDEIIDSGKYPLLEGKELTTNGFRNVSTKSWLWGYDITESLELFTGSWWGQVDLYTYGYQVSDTKAIDENLYNLIRNDDVRKGQFETKNKEFYLAPTNKFFDKKKKIDGIKEAISKDYIFMRIAELYLLNAEVSAKLGNEISAKNRLKTLLKTRISDISYIDDLSNQQLFDEIYLQTRIELWGEGKSYLAMKRFKKSITRGKNHLYHSQKTFNYNDDILTFSIPIAEIMNNPNIN